MKMKISDPEFGKRVRLLADRVGGISNLARLSGISLSMVKKYISGAADPSRMSLLSLVASADISFEWLATGKGTMTDEPVTDRAYKLVRDLNQKMRQGIMDRVETLRAEDQVKSDREPNYITTHGSAIGDYVFIPMVSGKISAGGGLEPDNMVDMAVAFRKSWILRKGDLRNMSVIRVDGDSMTPTLQSGDIVLINHNICSAASSGGIYAIAVQNEIMIKRIVVSIPDGKLSVVSDNKNYPDFIVDADSVTINGKAIWYGRDLER